MSTEEQRRLNREYKQRSRDKARVNPEIAGLLRRATEALEELVRIGQVLTVPDGQDRSGFRSGSVRRAGLDSSAQSTPKSKSPSTDTESTTAPRSENPLGDGRDLTPPDGQVLTPPDGQGRSGSDSQVRSERRSRPTWLTPFGEAWALLHGEPEYGELARHLARICRPQGPYLQADVLAAWKRYLGTVDGKYASAADFVKRHKHYGLGEIPVGTPQVFEPTQQPRVVPKCLHHSDRPAYGEVNRTQLCDECYSTAVGDRPRARVAGASRDFVGVAAHGIEGGK